ncbi:hypothetical protein MAR_022735 [Mya arenaria]|uniref:Uncharacterized protein n=1 Tax=Mya arenaria TaxID=6604 RepID=A0ABY7DL05_MYAAR|nr:hypothetical protein MAR_022735 [Mya arenaria]
MQRLRLQSHVPVCRPSTEISFQQYAIPTATLFLSYLQDIRSCRNWHMGPRTGVRPEGNGTIYLTRLDRSAFAFKIAVTMVLVVVVVEIPTGGVRDDNVIVSLQERFKKKTTENTAIRFHVCVSGFQSTSKSQIAIIWSRLSTVQRGFVLVCKIKLKLIAWLITVLYRLIGLN